MYYLLYYYYYAFKYLFLCPTFSLLFINKILIYVFFQHILMYLLIYLLMNSLFFPSPIQEMQALSQISTNSFLILWHNMHTVAGNITL